jgi:hypothetical protein
MFSCGQRDQLTPGFAVLDISPARECEDTACIPPRTLLSELAYGSIQSTSRLPASTALSLHCQLLMYTSFFTRFWKTGLLTNCNIGQTLREFFEDFAAKLQGDCKVGECHE